jgi:hypothetical protein
MKLTLTAGSTGSARIELVDPAPGERGSETISVTYNDGDDAKIALYAGEVGASELAHRLRVRIFESAHDRELLPFPVFSGSLADLAATDSFDRGVGRWTGLGDRRDHTVDYEIVWRLPKTAPARGGTTGFDVIVEAA